MPRGKSSDTPEQPMSDEERMESALAAVMGDGEMPKTREELEKMMQKVVQSFFQSMVQAQKNTRSIAEHLDVAFVGQTRVVGLDNIRKVRHELVTGDVAVPDPARPGQMIVRKNVHPGIFNMPWVDVVLPWTSEDERNFRAKRPTPYPKEYFPQVNGLAWRVVAGRKQRIPLVFAEALACAGVVRPEVLPDGNAVREYLEREEQIAAEAEQRRYRFWESLGLRMDDVADVRYVPGVPGATA